MNLLVIFAHPNQKSFCKAIVESVIKAAEDKEASVTVRDLYQLGFDPILKSSDFESLREGKTPDDVAKEQELVTWADVIVLVYPIWWAGFPAMLKGYIDRVFTYGFAYENVDGNIKGLLNDKIAILFSTTGASNEMYENNGMSNAIMQTSDEAIFSYTGFKEINHTFFGSVPYVTDEVRRGFLDEVERVIKEIVQVEEVEE